MSGQIQVKHTRGGRAVRERFYSLEEIQHGLLGILDADGVTVGLHDGIEVFASQEGSEREIQVNTQKGETMESVLRAASEDGEILGKTFIIDCTAEHRGAHGLSWESGCGLAVAERRTTSRDGWGGGR